VGSYGVDGKPFPAEGALSLFETRRDRLVATFGWFVGEDETEFANGVPLRKPLEQPREDCPWQGNSVGLGDVVAKCNARDPTPTERALMAAMTSTQMAVEQQIVHILPT